MKQHFMYPILFMMVLSLLFSTLLGFLNEATKMPIKGHEEQEMYRTILYVFDISVESDTSLRAAYDNYISEASYGDKKVFIAKKNGQVLGYAFPISGDALWGSVQGIAAVSGDFSTLKGVDFLSHSETPGLGGRISDSWFKEQFRGIPLEDGNPSPIIFRPSPGGNVDAIAGATLTSDAVKIIINEYITDFLDAKEALSYVE